jgi:hypothetical protein
MSRVRQCSAMTPADEGGYDYCVLDELPLHGFHKTWEGKEFELAIYVRRRSKRSAPKIRHIRMGVVERASMNALRACGLTSWEGQKRAASRRKQVGK